MKKTSVLAPAGQAGMSDLDQLMGERRAFSRIADSCSAADAECLRRMRDERMYRVRNVTWSQFCTRYLDISKSEANNIIQRFEEFGESYFDLSKIVRISPESYRAIAHTVKDKTIEWNGETIPLTSAHKQRINAAVQALRQAAAPKPVKRAIEPAPEPVSQDPVYDRIVVLQKQANEIASELRQICRAANCGSRHRQAIQSLAHELRYRMFDLEAAAA